jgi:predicted membrane-bound spermidine synthase
MLIGAIVGFAIGILFVEVIFANNQSWPDVVPFVLAIIGALVGREAARHMRTRASHQSSS